MPPPAKKARLDHRDISNVLHNDQIANTKALPQQATSQGPRRVVVRTKHRPVGRQSRPKLRKLEQMPLDILYEIFQHLSPRDLLNLARTSKGFRAELMLRSNAFLWKASRALAELPAPPECMSEPAFAHLLFCNHCHGCGKTSQSQILWPIPARYCRDCRQSKLSIDPSVISGIMSEAAVRVEDVVLHTRINGKGAELFHVPELDVIGTTWETLQDIDTKRQFIKERTETAVLWNELAPRLARWLRDYQRLLDADKDVLLKKRCVAALAKLRAEGWDNEIDMMTWGNLVRLSNLKQLASKAELTDKSWRDTRSEVIQFMSRFRRPSAPINEYRDRVRSRLRLLDRALWDYRRSKRPENAEYETECGIRFGDLAATKEVQALLEDQSSDLTRDVILTRLEHMIPSLADTWFEQCKSSHLSIAQAGLEAAGVAAVGEPLNLAIVSFQCLAEPRCRMELNLRWPQTLSHDCFRDANLVDGPPPRANKYEEEVWKYLQELGWDHAKWTIRRRFQADALKFAKGIEDRSQIVSLCGLDPTTATVQDMNNQGARFVCSICSSPETGRVICDWTRMLRHEKTDENGFHRQRKDALGNHWVRLPDQLAARARSLESTVTWKEYTCIWCHHSTEITGIRQHLQLRHEKAEPKLGVDYYCCEQRIREVSIYPESLLQDPEAQATVREGRGFFARF
ncbi:hypothetical protein BD309DRAFT_989309 [Dichomitus squalens]|nr:hypothetical protein BD309DRAFT_989309 [Dichomitus squalens]